MSHGNAQDVAPIVGQARVLLAGKPPEIQSAVLADLLATYLAGHIVRGSKAKTKRLREDLLGLHLGLVWELVPVNAEAIHGDRS